MAERTPDVQLEATLWRLRTDMIRICARTGFSVCPRVGEDDLAVAHGKVCTKKSEKDCV